MKTNCSRISSKNWTLIWLLGIAGQICWNVENNWFNSFVYAKIAKDPAIISTMVGVSAVVSTLSTFISGTYSDRKGTRKPFIAIGYILWGIFTVIFGMADLLPKNALTAAFVFVVTADAIMSFFGSMGYDAAFNSWTTDISDENNRGRVGGALAAMPVIATIFGAVVSGIIVDMLDYFAFFIIMGSIVIIVGIITLFTLKNAPSLKPKKDEKGFFHQFISVFNFKTVKQNKELFWVLIIMAAYFISSNIYFPYITIYFNNYLGMNYTSSGIIEGIGLVAAVFLTIPAAKLIEKGRSIEVIFIAVLLNSFGLFIISLSSFIPFLLIGIFFTGIGYVMLLQTLTAWLKNLYPEDQRGQYEGVKLIFFVCIPMIIGPAISNIVISDFGKRMTIDGVSGMVPTETLFRVSAVITLLTLLPLFPAKKLFHSRAGIMRRESK